MNADKIRAAVQTLRIALHDSGKAYLRIEIETQAVGLIDPNTGEIFADIENGAGVEKLIENL